MSAVAAENTSTEKPQAFKIDPDNPGYLETHFAKGDGLCDVCG